MISNMKGMTCLRVALLSVMSIMSQSAYSNIVVGMTRVIYPQNEKEVTVKLSNNGAGPILAQSWIDKGDVNEPPEKIQVPFVIVPPINRIDPGKSQTLRITYTGSPALSSTQETAYWLNVLEIPPVGKNRGPNKLQIAFRTRIKVFYRPKSLGKSDKAIAAAESLKWYSEQKKLSAKNDSPFYVSLVSVTDGAGKSLEGKMIPPYNTVSFPANEGININHGAKISYEYVNDWGAVKTINKTIQ
ncbi:fimbria/pilus periplasmic chaperone [Scandinavium sp. TWS1a]|uniref:fimbrial biogenesis chaperone n=1 Tax=Scandinavium tedordense TaxID=2926521 RepID=UPI0021662CFF|nr:fimbria/pilus periplasmic chaperone [Scandinavium tedordense]MCS2169598.1 fimbria/pilus periplasmic chaperone [Scandinavium tedordense]